jgi:type II secretory pathway pseudopilin PulG
MIKSFKGFALIEVVIVVILVSGSFLVFLEALNQTKKLQVRAEIISKQTMVLNQKINQFRAAGFDNVNGILNYTTLNNNSEFQYSLNVSFINDNLDVVSNAQTDYKLVEVKVRHSSNDYSPIKDIFIMTKK